MMLVFKLCMKSSRKGPSNDSVEITEFILKSIYLNLILKSTAIGTKFAPPHAFLFKNRIENDFFESEIVKLCLWLRYVDNTFFIRTKDEDKLERFLNCLDNFHPNLKFTHEKSKSSVNFLDVSVSIVDNKLETGKIAISLSTLILLTH